MLRARPRPWPLLALACVGLALACSSTSREPGARPQAAAEAPANQATPAVSPVEQAAPATPAPAPPPAPSRQAIELTFVGDVIYGRYRPDGYDPIPDPGERPFDEIAAQLKADVIVGNLETPVVRELPVKSPIGSRYSFGAPPEMAKILADAGFTAVSLANNHYFDQRQKGQRETPAILREHGIVPLGASVEEGDVFRVESVEKAGWRLGFLAITARVNAPQRDDAPKVPYLFTRDFTETLAPVLTAARADHDALIVVVHWGDEYADAPARVQRNEAHALIDAGADMVIGHHPHVLQGIERHGEGLVAYSLGNFLFENTTAIPRLTGVLRVRLEPREAREGASSRACVDAVIFHPAYIKRTPTKHPAPATDAMGKIVRGRMVKLSGELGSELTQAGEDLRMAGWSCAGAPQ
ncbi:MAG: CapA family protein [Nannocystaceae bacterium]|nr:CapA family protein [Myxococcales bacterium]